MTFPQGVWWGGQWQHHPRGWVPVALAASGAQGLHDRPHDD